MPIVSDVMIDDKVYMECDEFNMTPGHTYLVHSDSTGYFLGSYVDATRTYGAFIFNQCRFYTADYQGILVKSTKADKKEEMVCMVGIIVRKCA